MADTPTLDKMQEVADESQVIGEFLEWLSSQGLFLAHYDDGSHYPQAYHRATEELLADFFDIDLALAEREKRLILRELSNE